MDSTETGLLAGTYVVTVTDANGCTDSISYTINNSPGLTASISNTTDVLCNGGNDGTATVSVSGGFLPFTYQWNDPALQTTITATGLSAGTYTVTVTDSTGCSDTAVANVNEPMALNLNITYTEITCPGGNDGTATANVSGGTSPYTYQWNDPNNQNGQSAINLNSGTYTVTITDSNGCSISDSIFIPEPQPFTYSMSSTGANCNQSDGSVNIDVISGGTPGYSYQWSDGTNIVGTSDSVPNLPAGSYTVTVTDAVSCSFSDTISIPNIAGPIVTIDSVSNVSCYSGNDGFVNTIVTGGTSPYTYQWNDPNNQTTPFASNLPAGNYSVTVTDSNGCVASTTVAISEPPKLILTSNGTNPICFGDSSGSAFANASGGTGPYSFSWNTVPQQFGDYITGLTSGTYTVTVTDNNGCIETSTVTLNDPPQLTSSVSSTNVSCNSACDGTATVTVSNGVTPYSYQWDDPNNQSTQTASNLCAGNYNVTVTDANGCTVSNSVTITEPLPLIAILDTSGNVSCNGANDGFAKILVTGGTAPYTYLWTPGNYTLQSVSTLSAANYTVTVTDANGCSDIVNFSITEPPALSAVVLSSDVSCYNGNNGYAYITVSGGTQPYSYQWNDPALQTTDTAFILSAGTYSVTVTDNNGCVLTFNNITINQPPVLSVSASTSPALCGQSNGSATASVVGGVSPYNFQWNDPNNQTTATAVNLAGGNYQVIVTDANGCNASAFANVQSITGPSLIIDSVKDVSCNGYSDGSAHVSISGGTSPYSILWDDPNNQTTATAVNLAGGNYNVTVTDNNGCIASASVTINEATDLSINVINISNVSCNGGNDGSAEAIAGGGTPPYSFSWNTNPPQNTAIASNLTAGTYIITVNDSNNCVKYDTVTITEPLPLSINLDSLKNINCFGGSDGFLQISVTGGTPGYNYNWNPPVSTGQTVAGASAGTYQVTVTDANGCSISEQYTLSEPTALTIITSHSDASCNGTCNGDVNVIASNGTPGYSYLWTPGNYTTPYVNNLCAGTYYITVTDANGCQITGSETIAEPSPIDLSNNSSSPANCNQANGSATVNPTGGTPGYSYQWNDPNNQTTQTANGLSPGTYVVTVTDASNCSASISINVINIPGPSALVNNFTNTTCYDSCDATANVVANNGTLPYSFMWDNGQTGTSASNLCSGTHWVIVTDNAGCIDTAFVNINQPPPVNVVTSPDTTICIGGMAIISATASGGTPPYQLIWDNSLQGNGPHSVNPAYTTTYGVYAQDNNNCPSFQSFVTVNVLDSLNVNALMDQSVCPGTTVSLSALASGGNGNYSYSWSDGQNIIGNNNNINVQPESTTNYIVTLSDNCETPDVSDTVTITIYSLPQVAFSVDTALGCSPLTVTFYNNSTNYGNNCIWDFGDGSNPQNSCSSITHTFYSSGFYDVNLTVYSPNNCVNDTGYNDYIYVAPNPIADFTFNPMETTMSNTDIVFNDNSQGNIVSWYWLFSSFGDDTVKNPKFTFPKDTGYFPITLKVTTNYGCIDTVTKFLRINGEYMIFIPNTFTPNGNRLNEVFKPEGFGISDEDYGFYVFDRWGEIIFETHDWGDGWDGTVKGTGREAQIGTYAWKIDFKDINGKKHTKIGRVNLLR